MGFDLNRKLDTTGWCQCTECIAMSKIDDWCQCDICTGVVSSYDSSDKVNDQWCTCELCQTSYGFDDTEFYKDWCTCDDCCKTSKVKNSIFDAGKDRESSWCTCDECIQGISLGVSSENSKEVVVNQLVHYEHRENCCDQETGGFRVKDGSQTKWVENIIPDVVEGPVTCIQDFYIKAHDVIVKSGIPNFKGAKISVPTRLKLDEWSLRLNDYSDSGIIDLLTYGFPMGYSGKDLPVCEVKNHQGATDHAGFIDRYIQKEIEGGLILGPFDNNPLCLPLTISPLNSVPKKDSLERRVICDFSYPQGTAVNDGISKEMYLGDPVELVYPTVDSLALKLKQMGKGCHIFKKDLKKAYRQFNVDPGDIHLTGYCWSDRVFIDLALVMGSRSSAFLCQRVTNAVVHMAGNLNIFMLNYLDDLCVVSTVKNSQEKFIKVTNLLETLGLSESEEK